MSLGFILFVTVLHIIGKVRSLGLLSGEGCSRARLLQAQDQMLLMRCWRCCCFAISREAAAALHLLVHRLVLKAVRGHSSTAVAWLGLASVCTLSALVCSVTVAYLFVAAASWC
jgi:hypothetical protein